MDDQGLFVSGSSGDFPVNVAFGGQRVFSFWTGRDTTSRGGERFFAWPHQLRRFLNGAVEVSLVSPVDGTVFAETSAVLGDGEGVVSVVDKAGNPVGLDKSMRLSHLFGQRDGAEMEPLLDALEEVLEALEKAGVRPFVAYGTLLGAVRDQDFIGHDSDADIGYVSPYSEPADVIRESFDLQRSLQDMGYTVQRYSGMGLKVLVKENDGATRGLDVFGGFQREGKLYLMGEVGHPFRDEWLYPRTTAQLAGRSVPVPAEPEHLLEAMYGESWRVPDPAYKFTTPVSTQRRLNGWFRGTRVGLDTRWERRAARAEVVAERRSTFVEWAREQTPDAPTYVDVGCGGGRDAAWLSREGAPSVWALDYFQPDLRKAMRISARTGASVNVLWCNLLELRSLMETTARIARVPGPRVVLAHHLLDATDSYGRRNFLRLARMLTRDTGKAVVQAYVAPTEHSRALGVRPLREAAFADLVAASKGVVEHVEHLSEAEAGVAGGSNEKSIVRMVMSWSR
ncbi:hypothetical protein GCM10011584_03180 [Nocardioides phosphati]|uniref:Class I SAM-dependent methyltransferase n=1 Tax=Nocardioides phosphati TaxID=1867775 RepID=A0ABQ2N508_9ACTN|nr:hypothetical protein GCM10011584_03180 [Nocardioides phosphati]